MDDFDREIRKLSGDIKKAAVTTGPRAQIVVRKTATDIKADAKAIAIAKDIKDVGTLINSISTSDLRKVGRSGSLVVEIGPTVHYGIWHEIGTSVMPARPYMGPAADRRTPAFEQAMAQLAEEGLA